MGCTFNQLKNPNLKMCYYTSGNSQIRVAFTAAMMKLKGAKIPPKIVFPIQLQNQRCATPASRAIRRRPRRRRSSRCHLLKKMYP